MRVNINHLFPTPVIEYNIGRNFTEQEIEFMFSRKLKPNSTNSITLENKVLDSKELENIKSFVTECIKDYVDIAIAPKHKIHTYITESWVNVTEKGESHHIHKHPNSFISGVLYISADPEKDKILFHKKDSSYIFDVETDNFSLLNSNSWWLQAKSGVMYLFPSTLSHEVEKTTGDTVRVSLSFNTFIKGIIDTFMSTALTLE